MERVRHDVRIALRGFRRSPSFTVTAVAILAIGIGMAVAMFTVFDAVVVRPLPVTNQDRIVELYTYRGDPNADFFLLRDDLQKVAEPVLRHRLSTNFQAQAEGKTSEDIIALLLQHVGEPEPPKYGGPRKKL